MQALKEVNQQCARMCERLAEQDRKIKKMAKQQVSRSVLYYIRNLSFKKAKVHLSSSPVDGHPDCWVTACGWPYGSWRFERLSARDLTDTDKLKMCGTCLRSRAKVDNDSSSEFSEPSPN